MIYNLLTKNQNKNISDIYLRVSYLFFRFFKLLYLYSSRSMLLMHACAFFFSLLFS